MSTYQDDFTAFSCQGCCNSRESHCINNFKLASFLPYDRLSTHQNIEFTHKNLKAIYAAIKLLHAIKYKFITLFDPNYPCLLKQIYSSNNYTIRSW